MKKGFQILTVLVCALMLMGVTFVITYTAVSQHYGASEEAQQISQKTAELYAYLDHYFIGETDAAALSDAASSAMVDAIGDEWSYYIPADEYQQRLDMLQNAYVGIGITITQDEDTGAFPPFRILNPCRRNAAFKFLSFKPAFANGLLRVPNNCSSDTCRFSVNA